MNVYSGSCVYEVDTIGTTAACPLLGGVHTSEAPGVFLVGIAYYALAMWQCF